VKGDANVNCECLMIVAELKLLSYVHACVREIEILGYILLGLGHAVAQLVEALCYKPEGRGFDSRRYHRNFSLT
jgi:hypothetical protein